MALEGGDQAAFRQSPDTNGVVLTAGDAEQPVRDNGHPAGGAGGKGQGPGEGGMDLGVKRRAGPHSLRAAIGGC